MQNMLEAKNLTMAARDSSRRPVFFFFIVVTVDFLYSHSTVHFNRNL